MSMHFLTTALFIVSLTTNLTVEGMKKILDGLKRQYSANILAAITSVVIAGIMSAIYIILNDISFSLKIGINMFVLMYLSFLTSTVGYDKVAQMFQQIQNIKEE